MRWVLKQLRDETIQPTAATPEISCKMSIDLTRQSCAASLHWNHRILECLSGHGPLDQTGCTCSSPSTVTSSPWQLGSGAAGVPGGSPQPLQGLRRWEHAGPELKSLLLYLVPNPLCQKDFSKIIMKFQLWKHLGSSPEQCSGFRGFHSPAVILAEIDFLICSLSTYEIF